MPNGNTAFAGEGIPVDRLIPENTDARLERAKTLWLEQKYDQAVVEIKLQIANDSSLAQQAAQIIGGNYHLVRLTNNIFADRVGGFSPSGDKLIYTRDTSLTHYNDGLFEWYEDRTTGIVYYDFTKAQEFVPVIPEVNPFKPIFKDDESFYYLTSQYNDGTLTGKYDLHLYDFKYNQIKECFTLNGQGYCVAENLIINYDSNENMFITKDQNGNNLNTLFDNDTLLKFKRPLPLITNLSVGDSIIMFEAGYTFSKECKNIYGLPISGGIPKILFNNSQDYFSDYPAFAAAVNGHEFAYLLYSDGGNADIYYRVNDKIFRLSFDGGQKAYLAISPNGKKLAYSSMVETEGVESYEIFILDFAQDATFNDLMYRLNDITDNYER